MAAGGALVAEEQVDCLNQNQRLRPREPLSRPLGLEYARSRHEIRKEKGFPSDPVARKLTLRVPSAENETNADSSSHRNPS